MNKGSPNLPVQAQSELRRYIEGLLSFFVDQPAVKISIKLMKMDQACIHQNVYDCKIVIQESCWQEKISDENSACKIALARLAEAYLEAKNPDLSFRITIETATLKNK